MTYRAAPFAPAERGGTAVARRHATLLVASDGTPDADHAIALASALTGRDDTDVQIISVVEPTPDPIAWPGLAALPTMIDPRMLEDGRREAIRQQLERVAPSTPDIPFTVVSGSVATAVATAAAEIHADLVLTGRGRHRLSERLLGEEHLLRLIRDSRVPVLAAEDSLRGPPERVLVGVDFGQMQDAVIDGAIQWAVDGARLFLVHARPTRSLDGVDAAEWYDAYDANVRDRFAELRKEIEQASDVTVETRIVNGHAGMALSHFATTQDCDLIVVGAQGTGFVHRMVIGSVTTYLLRHARCSLLTIPAST